ncbi:chemotaxis protein CheW [Oleiagrimonas sp. C23AA]|uniref:chemotaxis protein CheW n=1 Tax=Oleiagrimonas sp. C23AA TaxID=2719047 RepID=UPI00141EA2FA|nr:chemotaxis protein CheW [Oleiagrimonas sp. C23AA]NII11988.1 chemotaxis protein CheW [Oleiagrimonas sp. C23AA]
MSTANATPFELLADYERRSLAHSAGQPEQIETPGLWRGIGFRVGHRVLASAIDEVSELLTPPSLTPVPGTQDWLLGIANIRGNLVPVVDLGWFLFDQRTLPGDRSRVLLVRQQGGHVGLLVDEVLGQRNVVEEQRANAQSEDDARLSRFVLENVTTSDETLGLFSMSRLARAPDFLQAAA